MNLPEKLLESLEGIKGFDKESFKKIHESGEHVTSVRTNPRKKFEIRNPKFEISPVPWCEHGYYLKERPSFTFDPLFHAGCYYVQEASSMFLEQALKQTIDLSRPLRILDLAAAPGGKSTHIQSLISKESLLVSNEVIRSRANILKDNIIKWGTDNVVVTINDPGNFPGLENYFDVIVVDAPCSGSGLFRRDEGAIGEWSENNVRLCSHRQQRILADVWPSLKRNGILIYSTCSYSKEEDEEILDWLHSEFVIQNFDLSIMSDWNIVESAGGYRFWPDRVKGEGFYIACVRKLDGEENAEVRGNKGFGLLNKKDKDIVKEWLTGTDHEFVKVHNKVYAVAKNLLSDCNFLSGCLHVIYFGTMVGELMRDKLIPDHALAMSELVSKNIKRIELNDKQAIAYLQKKELKIVGAARGWALVTYNNYALGWVNVLQNRINNYYPKELRILKDI